LRWLVPAGAAAVVAVIASGMLSADANPNLPSQTAAQLLASVSDAKVAGFSGTIVEKASLGLPELPNVAGADSSTSLTSLLTGSHTTRVWYAGPTKQRVALLDSLGEQDVFHNGRDLWQWNSDTRTASHTLLPAEAATASPAQVPSVTPSEAASRALAAIDPSTTVTTDRTGSVAGRSTYTLVLTPKDTRSTVGSVRISVDGKTKVPLGVQVYPRGSDRAALDIAFTRVNFSVPDNDFFTFSPPAGVTMKQNAAPVLGGTHVGAGGGYSTVGSGWTAVAKLTGAPSLGELGSQARKQGRQQADQAAGMLAALPQVSGSWGKGRLLTSTLINALITDDGRVFVGAVGPDLLYAAAAK
jgi:outer membrane lipoprotein-sorting protein